MHFFKFYKSVMMFCRIIHLVAMVYIKIKIQKTKHNINTDSDILL